MLKKIKITASAKEDIKTAQKWYKERSLQAAENFTLELTTAIDNLQISFAEHRKVYKNFQKLSLKKFPFSIYYQSEQNSIIIQAVLHKRRSHGFLTERLDDE